MNSATSRTTNNSRSIQYRCPAPDCHCIISQPLVSLHNGELIDCRDSDKLHHGRRYTIALPIFHQSTSTETNEHDIATNTNSSSVFCPTCFTAVLHCECCAALVLDLPTEDEVHCTHCGYLVISDSVLREQLFGLDAQLRPMPSTVLRAIQLQINAPKFIQAIHDVFKQCVAHLDSHSATETSHISSSSSINQHAQGDHSGHKQDRHGHKRKSKFFESPFNHSEAGGGDIYTEEDSDCSAALDSAVKRRRIGRSPPGTMGPFTSPLLVLQTGDRMARPPYVRRPRAVVNPHVARDILLVACHQLRLQLVDPHVIEMDKIFIHSFATRDIDEPMSPSDLVILRALYPDCLDAAQSLAHLGHASASQQSPIPAARTRSEPMTRPPVLPSSSPAQPIVAHDTAVEIVSTTAAAGTSNAEPLAGEVVTSGEVVGAEGKENLSQGGASQEVVQESGETGTGHNLEAGNHKNRREQGVVARPDASMMISNTDMMIIEEGGGATPASEPRMGRVLLAPNTHKTSSSVWQSPVSHLYCAQDDAATPSEDKRKHVQLVKILNVMLPVWLARSSDRVACRYEWKQAEDALQEFEQMRNGGGGGNISIPGNSTAHAVATRFFLDQRDRCKRAYLDSCSNGVELLETINIVIKGLFACARALIARQRQLRYLGTTPSFISFFSRPSRRQHHNTVPDALSTANYHPMSQQESSGSNSSMSGISGMHSHRRSNVKEAAAATSGAQPQLSESVHTLIKGGGITDRLESFAVKRGGHVASKGDGAAVAGVSKGLVRTSYTLAGCAAGVSPVLSSSSSTKVLGPDAWLLLQQEIADVHVRVQRWRGVYVAVASACFFEPTLHWSGR